MSRWVTDTFNRNTVTIENLRGPGMFCPERGTAVYPYLGQQADTELGASAKRRVSQTMLCILNRDGRKSALQPRQAESCLTSAQSMRGHKSLL